MSPEEQIRVGGHKEVGGEIGSSSGGVKYDVQLGPLLSSESALFLAVASYLPCRDAAALGSVDKERRRAYATHRNALWEPTLNVLNRILSSESALFLEVASHLSCQDAVALGSVDKERRRAYVAHRNALLEPTLNVLDRMCGGNHFCEGCGETQNRCTCGGGRDFHLMPFVDVDPRYRDAYYDLPTCEKVEELVAFLKEVVSNMRSRLKLTDAADPNNMHKLIGNHPGEKWHVGNDEVAAILKLYPRRAALAFNLALASLAASEMVEGELYFCEEAFLGIGDIRWNGSSFEVCICLAVSKMHPFSDEAFGELLRDEILPSANTRSVLGTALTRRLVLCAPFGEEWLDGDGDIALPGGLEPYDVAVAKSAVNEVFERLRERYGETRARELMRETRRWIKAVKS